MVAVIVVVLSTVTPLAPAPPMTTDAPGRKPVPVIEIGVPPVVVPVFGESEATVGAAFAVEVKPEASDPICPSGFVTVTVAAPDTRWGVVAVSDAALTHVTLVAATPPMATVAPPTKFVPVTVIVVPPAAAPVFGVTALTVGAASGVNV